MNSSSAVDETIMTLIYLVLTAIALLAGCSQASSAVIGLKHYPIQDLKGVLTRSDVALDPEITSDGNGSLRISVDQASTIHLYETGDLDVENARITYQAKVRTENVEGRAYLEMWCQFSGRGEYFSRDLNSPLTGTVDWSAEEIPFFLKKGENPDNIKLNLVVEGKGTVWIDDIRLLQAPLR